MKNIINFYYNIDVQDIHQRNKIFYFKINDSEYNFSLYNGDISKINYIYNIHMQLLQRGLYCHQIMMNIYNEPLTQIEGKYYILLKINIIDRKIQYEDVLNFSKTYLIYENNYPSKKWDDLWEIKTDYIEYQISQFSIKYPILSRSINYYLGLAETAILYLKNHKIERKIHSVSHRRLTHDSTLIDLYNPVNFIIDLPVRDICEYLKDMFFEKDIDIVMNMIDLDLNRDDSILFLCRMLYPSYYFDVLQKCIDNSNEEKEVLKYINKVNEYEQMLGKIIKYLKNKYNIDNIEWLIKT